jgi:hypothetical protein
MRVRALGAILAGGISIGLLAGHWTTRAAEGEGAHIGTSPLAGKYLVIRMDRTLERSAAYLANADIQRIGDETFLVGKGFALRPEWKGYENQVIWISAKHIEQMYTFDSVDDVNKMYEKPQE